MRIVTVINQKGGTAKTTTAWALAGGLREMGFKVLLIDADPQGNLTYTMGASAQAEKASLYDVLVGRKTAEAAIVRTEMGDIIPSHINLAAADMEFVRPGREHLLDEAILPDVRMKYEYIVVDAPPSLGIMAVNALTMSSDVVIPMCADVFSLQGLRLLLDTVGMVRKYLNQFLNVDGILITRRQMNGAIATRTAIEAIKSAAEAERIRVYDSIIRESVAVKEAQMLQESLYESAPNASVTEDYRKFVHEFNNY